MVMLTVFASLASHSRPPVVAQTEPGTIAYVRPNNVTGDEIWLIEPDGSNNRRIWTVGQPDPGNIDAISDIDWRPDAGEIAFSSDHEFACSLFESDLYAIRPDGSGYRRITNSPACASLANFPQGSVTVTVRNFTTLNPLFVYIQGAPEPQSVIVSQGSSATVTFPDVADFGDGFLQQAVVIWGLDRWLAPIALADVIPGQTVHAGTIDVAGAGTEQFGAYIPSWHSDGSRLGYILVSAGSMYHVPADPVAGDYGQSLLNLGPGNVPSSDVMDWGPTPAVANQILYTSYLNSGIYRVTEGSNNLGTKLVNLGIEQVIDVQWLPDGSGFLFTKGNFLDYANVYRYDFATSAATPLTEFTDEFAIDVSVSPDGQWIVFERSETNEFTAGDLWIMRWDGTEMQLLVQNGLRPSWSQHALPPPLTQRNYIPLVLR
jgi:Tol biopolymer transport system component